MFEDLEGGQLTREALRSRMRDRVRATFWGMTDGDPWLNNWPVRGHIHQPLLFDRDGCPKPAFYAVLAAALSHRSPRKVRRDTGLCGPVRTRPHVLKTKAAWIFIHAAK